MSYIYISIVSNKLNVIVNNQPDHMITSNTSIKPYSNNNNYSTQTNQNFKFILNPKYSICKNDLLILFYSITSVSHFKQRQQIRQLWSNRTMYPQVRFVFMTGLSLNQTINQLIKSESQFYGDIVQQDFLDSYFNLTLKTMMSLKWISKYCSNSVYSVKLDDDVVINLNYLIEYLDRFKASYYNSNFENIVLCKPWYNAVVSRDNNSKFYTDESEYSNKNYPTYCDGPAYIYSTDLAIKLFEMSKHVKLFKFEDVYFGMLIANYNSNLTNTIEIKDYDDKYHDNFNINRNLTEYISRTCFFIYSVNVYNFTYVWNYLIH